MAKVTVPSDQQDEQFNISPDYVRISMAAAIELGLKPGRINRCNCNCINLLQNYPEGCYANCSYCGLARERPGTPEENTFIRVAWPLYPTDLVAEKIAERIRKDILNTNITLLDGRDRRIELHGPSWLVRDFPTWNARSMFAHIKPASSSAAD